MKISIVIHKGCPIGHIPVFIVNYRYQNYGQSADLRVRANMAKETAVIQPEYGVPGGLMRKAILFYARFKRRRN